jgi:hypothetical protein
VAKKICGKVFSTPEEEGRLHQQNLSWRAPAVCLTNSGSKETPYRQKIG